jgi:transcriptional regulator with XRE-family HTH domain
MITSIAKDPRVKAGAPCKVRRRGFAGQGFVWVDGTFKEAHGKGAFVITAKDGNSNFYHWNEIELIYPEPKITATIATLGEALPALVRLATPDRSQIAVTPEPPKPPPPPRPTPAPPPSSARQRAPSTPHRKVSTEIGIKLRQARQDDEQTQATAAAGLGISPTRLSNIETGAIIPTSDELVLFSAYYDLPLEDLEALGDAAEPARAPLEPRSSPPGPPARVDYVVAIAAVIEALAPLTIAERRAILGPLLKVL